VVPHVTEQVLPAIRYSMGGLLGSNVLALPDADGYIHVRGGKLAAANAHEINLHEPADAAERRHFSPER
jgi:hypothetical protein